MPSLEERRQKLSKSFLRIESVNPNSVESEPTDKADQVYRASYDEWMQYLTIMDRLQDHGLRRLFAEGLFVLMCAWLIGVFALLLLSGWEVSIAGHYFDLPSEVLLAVIASTIVPGLLTVVLRYLFKDTTAGKSE